MFHFFNYSAFYIWRANKNAIYLAAIVGGFADLGYFLFMDLGGFVNFIHGTIITIISASAIALSIYANFKMKSNINMHEMWNERYRSTEYAYGTDPNAFFKASREKYNLTGSILFPAEEEVKMIK